MNLLNQRKNFVFPAVDKIIKKSGVFESVTVDGELKHFDQWFNPRHMNVNVEGSVNHLLNENFFIC